MTDRASKSKRKLAPQKPCESKTVLIRMKCPTRIQEFVWDEKEVDINISYLQEKLGWTLVEEVEEVEDWQIIHSAGFILENLNHKKGIEDLSSLT